MFGQTPNTPFGGGGFGQPTNTAPAFGSPAPAPSLFGGPTQTGGGAFGQPSGGFGQPSAPPAPGFGGFGAPAPAPSMFGAPAPSGFGAPSAFGAPAPSAFGAPAGGGLFGSSAPAPSTGFGGGLFGQAPAPSTFGAPSSGFGSTTFGAPAPSGGGLFGAPAPAFGAPTPAFGSPAPAFGAPAPSAFGTAPAPSVFGTAPPASTSFFGSPAPAPFGAPAPTSTGLFGSPAPAQFGAPAPTTGLFGAPAPAPGGFGASSGLFGSPAPGTAAMGTHVAPYQVTTRQDGSSNIVLQSITAMEQYKDQSHEELRFADYSLGNRGTAAPVPSMYGGGFGAPAPVGGGLFGSAPAPVSAFGSSPAPVGGLFGSPPAPAFGSAPAPLTGAFGQPPASGGLFGQAPAPSAFGAPAQSAFGASAPSAFGAPAPSAGLFGAPAPSGGLFGAPAPAPFGAPAPAPMGGLFGSAPAPTSTFGGGTGLFGNSPAPGLFGAPAPGLFGAPAPTTGGLFGSPAPAPFGQQSLFGAPTQSLFGSAPAPAFGASAPTGYFGPPSSLQQQPQAGHSLFNPQVPAPAMTEVIEQQIRALDNQLSELKKMEIWKGPRASSSPAATPTNNPDINHFFASNPQPVGLPVLTPQSSTQIRPRGFAQNESSTRNDISWSSGRKDNSALMSPEAFVRSSQLNLVVRPDSLRRSNKLHLQIGGNQDEPSPEDRILETIERPPTEESPPPAAAARSNQTGAPESVGKSRSLHVEETALTSPGYEYYKQVIGTSHDPGHPITPAAENGVSHQAPWYVPKLSKLGYEVSPSIAELENMSEADLASVHSFSMRRPGYGKVEWEGSVDVRGANLDDIVVIEVKDVSVYDKDEKKGTKPEEGTKLNRPAVITFDGVFPKEGPRATEEVMERFAKKVQIASQTMNAEFVSYDTKTGIWKIRVYHFSRYALDDDDDSDDIGEGVAEAKVKAQFSLARQSHSHKTVRKATPCKPRSRMSLEYMDSNELDRDFERDVNIVSDVESTTMDITEEAELAAKAIRAAMVNENHVPMENLLDREVIAYEGDEEYEVPEPQATERRVYEEQVQEDFMIFPKRSSLFTDVLHINPLKTVCGTRMGRSFRVGWCPNGAFIKLVGTSMTTLVIARPVLSDETSDTSTVELLESQQNNAVKLSFEEADCPLFTLSRNCRHCADYFRDSDQAKQVFLLLSRIFPSDHLETNSAAYEDKVPLEACFMAAVVSFLRNLCALNKPQDLSEDVFAVVLDAFSSGNIALACESAASGGAYTALATILASCSVCHNDVARFLGEMKESSSWKLKTDPRSIRILKDLEGKFTWEDACFHDGNADMDWSRRILLRILQRPNVSLQGIFNTYEGALTSGDAPFPHPPYLKGSNSSVKSFFYKLLQICADPSTMTVTEAIDPCGHTPYCHDLELAFHVAAALTSVSNDTFALSIFDAECIKDTFVTQLVMRGRWELAVFVTLCCICNDSSLSSMKLLYTSRAKNLVLQHFTKNDPRAYDRRLFLVQNVGIPTIWFDEALCFREAYDGNAESCIGLARVIDSELARNAHVELMLPELILRTNSAEVVSIVTHLSQGAPQDSIAVALARFFDIEMRIMDISKQMETTDVELEADMIQNFQENLDYVYEFFSLLYEPWKTSDATGKSVGLLFPQPSKPVPFSASVFEVLQKVLKLKEKFKLILAGSN
jgi:Nucleoporin autopeptidase/Nuclear protein 96/Nucleoporin FG repeat region